MVWFPLKKKLIGILYLLKAIVVNFYWFDETAKTYYKFLRDPLETSLEDEKDSVRSVFRMNTLQYFFFIIVSDLKL